MAKEGSQEKRIFSGIIKICDLVDGDVSAEVIATDFEGMMKEGKDLALISENIVMKVPVTKMELRLFLRSQNKTFDQL